MRWSEPRETWVLERRANYRRREVNPDKYPRTAVDTFIRMRDGYYLAGEYAPDRLPEPHRLVAYLRSQDPNLRADFAGDPVEAAARYAQRLEEKERAAEERAAKNERPSETGAAQELYDMLAWEEGRRVSVPRDAQGL